MEKEPIYKMFRAALEDCVEKAGRGTQAFIARVAGEKRSYVNDILKGRKYGSEETRRAIARALGYEYEDFLNLGRKILQRTADEDPVESFPHSEDIKAFGEHTDERAWAIMIAASRQAGVEAPILDYMMPALAQADPDYRRFRDGELTDRAYFEICFRKLTDEERIENARRQISRMKEIRKQFER